MQLCTGTMQRKLYYLDSSREPRPRDISCLYGKYDPFWSCHKPSKQGNFSILCAVYYVISFLFQLSYLSG